MKTLKELRASLSKLKDEAQALIDAGIETEEDQEAFDDKMKEFNSVKAQIANLERMESAGSYLDGSPGRKTSPDEFADDAEITGGHDRSRDDPWCGFTGAHDFVTAVRSGSRKSGAVVDPRLAAIPELMGAPTNFHRETASDEGYHVPPALRDGVLEAIEALNEDIFTDVDAEPTGSNAVEYIRDESTPWGGTGIIAYWTVEGNQLTGTRLVTKMARLEVHKMSILCLASGELLADGPRIFDRLTRKAAMAIVWTGSKAIFSGTGAGQPLGFRAAAYGGSVSVAKETSQTAKTVNADNVAKMYSRCINPTRGIWYINQDVFPQLLTMTLGDQPIFIPPNQGIQQAPGGSLLGRPVKISEHCETLGTKGDIVFANPMEGYYSPRRAGTDFAQSMHLYFDYDVEAFRWLFRMGGTPTLESAISPAKGSSTRSHFVTLDTRA